MKRSAPSLILLFAFVPALWGQAGPPPSEKPGPRAAVRTRQEPAIWVDFVPIPKGAPVRTTGGGQGTLDLGQVSYLGGATRDGVTVTRRGRFFVVSTVFGLRVGSQANSGTAKLIGLITDMNAVNRVSIDGVRLSLVPQVIQMGLACGAVSEHKLAIEVPGDTPELAGQIFQSIAFQVVAN